MVPLGKLFRSIELTFNESLHCCINPAHLHYRSRFPGHSFYYFGGYIYPRSMLSRKLKRCASPRLAMSLFDVDSSQPVRLHTVLDCPNSEDRPIERSTITQKTKNEATMIVQSHHGAEYQMQCAVPLISHAWASLINWLECHIRYGVLSRSIKSYMNNRY